MNNVVNHKVCKKMHERAWELLEAMGNCYRACNEDYETSLDMISGWRGFKASEVENILIEMSKEIGNDSKFLKLRKRFPKEFPV